MSGKVLKRSVSLFLCAALIGLLWHAIRPTHDAVAKPEGSAALIFQGGAGDTPATAVIIVGASDYIAVVGGEYQYLSKHFGKPDHDWQIAKKEVFQHADQVYDIVTLEFPRGAKQQIFFDITKYFKKP